MNARVERARVVVGSVAMESRARRVPTRGSGRARRWVGSRAGEDDAGASLTAVGVVAGVARGTARDATTALALALAAGCWAQAVNLGGTFLLALVGAHEIPIVAATFALGAAGWKFACAQMVRAETLRRAAARTEGGGASASALGFRDAFAALGASRSRLRPLLVVDARRTLSIAWNSLITVPVPYLGLIRLLDYAVAGCVIVNEPERTAGEALKRSQELMYGYRWLALRAAFLCSTAAAALVGGVVGVFVALFPTLPRLMVPLVDPVTGVATTAGDALAGFINGAAFDRVWVMGSPAERAATMALLACGLTLSFLFTLGFRELVSLLYVETKARYVPPPPASAQDGSEGVSVWRRLQFWRKDAPTP